MSATTMTLVALVALAVAPFVMAECPTGYNNNPGNLWANNPASSTCTTAASCQTDAVAIAYCCTAAPTPAPTAPTAAPTGAPTSAAATPTGAPTAAGATPTGAPTAAAGATPTAAPTAAGAPTTAPTAAPTPCTGCCQSVYTAGTRCTAATHYLGDATQQAAVRDTAATAATFDATCCQTRATCNEFWAYGSNSGGGSNSGTTTTGGTTTGGTTTGGTTTGDTTTAVIARTITQTVKFPNPLTASTYAGTVKSTYEAGYAAALNFYDHGNARIKTGNSVTSTVARRAADVTFVASLVAADVSLAESSVQYLMASQLQSGIQGVITTTGVSGTVTAYLPTNIGTASLATPAGTTTGGSTTGGTTTGGTTTGGTTTGGTTTGGTTTGGITDTRTRVSQVLTFGGNARASGLTGDVKTAIELGYAQAIGLYDTTTKQVKTGSSVSATAVDTRRAATVTYVALVAQADAAAATTAATSLTPLLFDVAVLLVIADKSLPVVISTPSNVAAPTSVPCSSSTVSCSTTSGASKATKASLMTAVVICFFVAMVQLDFK